MIAADESSSLEVSTRSRTCVVVEQIDEEVVGQLPRRSVSTPSGHVAEVGTENAQATDQHHSGVDSPSSAALSSSVGLHRGRVFR
jgi:hypothetical protein